MATEIRRLIFSHDEAIEALRSFGNKNGISFPAGKIIRARFAGNAEYEIHSMKELRSKIQRDYNVKENPRAVTITIFCDATLEQKYYNLTANFISAALIEYCIHNKIMLPKDAEKRLDLTDFNICLDISKESFTEADQPGSRLHLED